ncbi:MAG: hypothetical protein E3J72_15880 [Planctomycetota bacterium]|nr:MAG: hypothetical protein E3J72_15880 [Planctomycetota bacterium]
MFTAQDMFNHINKLRGEYTSHGPYDGYPWKGQNADSMTWSITMTADSGLTGEAQAEAERVRDGGDPAGERFGYQNGGGEPFWATGIDTPKYMITGWSTDQLDGNLYGRWHTKANGTFRLGCAYQSGSGQYNKKHLLGVGKADVQDKNEIWWVLIFGE